MLTISPVLLIWVLVALAACTFFTFRILTRFQSSTRDVGPVPQLGPLPERRILVDGSNVMYWGGDPSLKVLLRVLITLQNKGFAPYVYFDANVGYKLFGRHVENAEMVEKLGLQPEQVIHAPSGTPADELILNHASVEGLRIVTNDRFLDWKPRFPALGRRGILIKGMWKEGSVILPLLDRQ